MFVDEESEAQRIICLMLPSLQQVNLGSSGVSSFRYLIELENLNKIQHQATQLEVILNAPVSGYITDDRRINSPGKGLSDTALGSVLLFHT